MSLNNIEKFKTKMNNGTVCIGTCISSPDPVVSELFADTGYDFTWVDTEHSPVDIGSALGHIMAARGTDLAPLVRVPWNDPVLMKPILELGPAGIIVPLIRTKNDVENAVKACKYPPKGIRGFGPRRGNKFGSINCQTYLKDADDRTMVIIQVEHIDAVNNLDEILEVEELDAIALGPMDLSGSMGLLGQTDHPEVLKVIEEVAKKVRKTDKYLGVATGYNPEKFKWWVDCGIQWIALNYDYGNMQSYSQTVLNGARQIAGQ